MIMACAAARLPQGGTLVEEDIDAATFKQLSAHIKPSDGSSAVTHLVAHLTGMHSAIKMLNSCIRILHHHLVSIQKGHDGAVNARVDGTCEQCNDALGVGYPNIYLLLFGLGSSSYSS
ncbi:hypothetical protein CY35_01G029400 [Sphagnum magellanicum]|nr:hypothetical protein CY35_01G029400 [Sphagnum magellanicum]